MPADGIMDQLSSPIDELAGKLQANWPKVLV